ncbi:MAG: outer membrane beta-barrel protein [Saprospiraceae bacterium]|nr:outer membrane beta-barrel protein [Saprospiraceae bacterium]
MSWHNLSGKEFDTKIKSYLAGKEVSFDPNAWNKMNAKLDQVFPGTNSRNGSNNWGLIVLVLILTVFFFWNLDQNKAFSDLRVLSQTELSKNHSQAATGSQQSAQAPTPDYSEFTETNIESSPAQRSSESTTIASDHESLSPASSAKPKISPDRQNTSPDKTHPTDLASENRAKKGIESKPIDAPAKSSAKKSTLLTTQPLEDLEPPSRYSPDVASTSVSPQARNRNTGGSGESLGIYRSNAEEIMGLGPDINWMTMSSESPAGVSSVEVTEPPVVKASYSRWSIGLGYAPDLSLVGFSELTSPGTNVGITIDYRLGTKWSIQTGATYAKKNYVAEGEDYSPPQGFWYYGVVPEYADATCKVIDIPINIRYYIKHKKRHSFYASMGLSTYLMLREDYEYDYEQYDPKLPKDLQVRNENQHFLGIYNFSLGYQRSLSPNWSLEIEPFIKAPLSGIGFGDVNLWSTGTFFSIRYHLSH